MHTVTTLIERLERIARHHPNAPVHLRAEMDLLSDASEDEDASVPSSLECDADDDDVLDALEAVEPWPINSDDADETNFNAVSVTNSVGAVRLIQAHDDDDPFVLLSETREPPSSV